MLTSSPSNVWLHLLRRFLHDSHARWTPVACVSHVFACAHVQGFHARLRFRKNSLLAAKVIMDDDMLGNTGEFAMNRRAIGCRARSLLSSHEFGRIWRSRDHSVHVMLVFVPRVLHTLIGFNPAQNVDASAGVCILIHLCLDCEMRHSMNVMWRSARITNAHPDTG